MLGSTLGFAAAANYPAPFVAGGQADVAVIVGNIAQPSDYLAATNVGVNLQATLASQTATGGTTNEVTVTGENAPLFTGSTKIYVNDSINVVRNVVTKADLPTILADGSFSGNVDATYTQVIDIGGNPRLTFDKMPTSSEDPEFGFLTSTTSTNYIYNASITFNKAVAFNHSDSEGNDIDLFGTTFTIASATTGTNFVLFKSAEKVSLSSDDPSTEVTVDGETYTIELVSASDGAATIQVTNSAGDSENKEVSENASKKINGLNVAVTTADETNLKLSATIIMGAEKLTLTDGSTVTTGDDDSVVDGTLVTITGGVNAMTKLVVSAMAPDSDTDTIKPDTEYVDPVFGTFKVDFPLLSIPEDSTSRETITVNPSGDDKMEVKFADYNGDEATIQFAMNSTNSDSKPYLQVDSDGHNMSVFEREILHRNDYVVVGNEDDGRLLKVSSIVNQTSGWSNDKVKFTDVFSGGTYEATITNDGAGTVTIAGKVYNVVYEGLSTASEDARIVRLNYPDSSAAGQAVVYPTIQTSKGAKLAFYEPLTNITVHNWDGAGNALTTLKFPDGDGYTDITFSQNGTNLGVISVIVNGIGLGGVNNVNSTTFSIGQLTYNVSVNATRDIGLSAGNGTSLRLIEPDGAGEMDNPAIIIFEEKDDNSVYEAMVVQLEAGGNADDGIGVNDVIRTWEADGSDWEKTLASDSKKTKEVDLFGTISTIDSSDSDQKSVIISYPDEQVYAQVYISEVGATTSGGGTSGGTVSDLGTVTFKDTEASQVSDKNLIVVGGSCVNTVAARILTGSEAALCGADFTAQAGVSTGQFLLKVAASPLNADKIAMLVAGYDAADTASGVDYVTNEAPSTEVGEMRLTRGTYDTVTAAADAAA